MDESIKEYNIDELKKLIEEIESHINLTVVGSGLDNLYNELTEKQKALYKLSLDKKTKKSYNYDILRIKKMLQLYYNELLYFFKQRYNSITKKISSINNSEEKAKYEVMLKNIKILDFCDNRISNPQDKLHISFEQLSNNTKDLLELEKSLRIIPVKTGNLKLSYISDFEITDIENEIFEYNNGNKQITKDIIMLDIDLVRNKIKKLNDRYNDNVEITNKCSEMLKYLDTMHSKINNNEKNEKINQDEEVYHIEHLEDSQNIYKRHSKKALLAMGIASFALADTTIGLILIPSLIYANMHTNKSEIMDKINNILAKSVNTKKEKDNTYKKANGIKIDGEDAINNILKGIAIIGTKSKGIATSLLNRVKNLSIVVKTKEHAHNIKEHLNTRRDEYQDLKIIKLYYEFILSNKTLEEFCSARSLTNDEFIGLVDYMNYKDDLDNKEGKTNGR